MRASILGVGLVIATCSLLEPAMAQRRERPRPVLVPSQEFPTIQDGIDAVADGGTVIIRPGVYNLEDEPLRISGKRLRLIGSGAQGPDRTELVRPVPREVVAADLAHGVIEYGPGGGGELKNVLLRGGDTGILGNAREGARTALQVKGTFIADTGRGILWRSNSDLTVKDTHISNTLWHGISVVTDRATQLTFDDIILVGEGGFGFGFFSFGGCPTINNPLVGGWPLGGIGIFGGCAEIVGGSLFDNFYAGIRLEGTGAFVSGTQIFNTHPRSSDGGFGDGVLARLSAVTLSGLDIEGSARAGVSIFGSFVALEATLLNCNAIDLDAEVFGSDLPSWDDLGDNTCKCESFVVACQFKSFDLAPPDALTEPE